MSSRHGRKDNTKTNLEQTMWEDGDRLHLAQDTEMWRAVLNMAMNRRAP
jgi:hypothetical protein